MNWIARAAPLTSLALLTVFAVELPSAQALDAGPIRPAPGPDLLQPVAVFGPDNRVSLPKSYRHLRNRIGVLYETRSRSVCTAFCVDQSVVATAAHCLFRTSTETAPKLNGFVFQLDAPGASGGARIAGVERGFGALNVLSGSTRLSISPPIEATRDWALIKLSRPICTAGGLKVAPYTPTEISALAQAGRVYHVAYHRDLAKWELSHGGPCWMRRGESAQERATIEQDFDSTSDLILHTCDTGGASSGSPLLVDGPAGPEVVGINVGTYVRSKVLMQNGEVLHRYKSDAVSNTAVASAAFYGAFQTFARAQILDTRAEVQLLQDRLRLHGFYSGPRDGAYGPMLRAAIQNFEKSQSRPVLGLASADLLKRLIEDGAATASPAAEIPTIETGSIEPSAARKRR